MLSSSICMRYQRQTSTRRALENNHTGINRLLWKRMASGMQPSVLTGKDSISSCRLQCSSSCHKKETYREVKCVKENQIPVNEKLCDPALKPPSLRKCTAAPCKYIVITVDSSQVNSPLRDQGFVSCLLTQGEILKQSASSPSVLLMVARLLLINLNLQKFGYLLT